MTDRPIAQRQAAARVSPSSKPRAPQSAAPRVEPRSRRAAIEAPAHASPEAVLAAQRAYGNRAITQVLQRAAAAGSGAAPAQPAPSTAPDRTGLPDGLKAGVEALSGLSLDHVQVHYNSTRPAAVQAHAYAQGSDIHLAPGQERHLPHEAWHVVQQAQGRVRATLQLKAGLPVNADPALEHEADVMGQRAAAMPLPAASKSTPPPVRLNRQAILRVAQMSFLEKVQELVFHTTHPRAKQVISDLAQRAEAFKPALDEEAFGPAELAKVAKSMKYADDYVVRLAKGMAFKKDDIPAHTHVVEATKAYTSVESFHQGSTDPDTHQLIFSNDFSSQGNATMKSNYLNPLLADFTAADVMKVQTGLALPAKGGLFGRSKQPGLTTITRKNIQSINGRTWLEETFPDEAARKGQAELDAAQLATFLTKTDNGKSSVKLAQQQDSEIVAGAITFEADGSFSVTLTLSKPAKKKAGPKKTIGLKKKGPETK